LKKGIGPFALLFIGLFGTLIISGLAFIALYNRTSVSKRAMIEINVIDGINKLELTKIALGQSLGYSFYQSSYLLSTQGGYFDLTEVDSYNCIPYWRVYNHASSPDYENNLEKLTLGIFNDYCVSLNSETQVPDYNSVSIEKFSGGSKVRVSSDKDLEIDRPKFRVSEDSVFTLEDKLKILRLFEIGKGNFIDVDSIGDQIKSSSTYGDAVQKISSLERELNNELVGYSEDSIIIKLTPGGNLGSDDSNYAIKVLVEIIDISDKYLVYDYYSKKTELKNIGLRFYVLTGNYQVDPETNYCEIV